MPDVGNTLVISGNPAIVDIEKQIAPEFDPTVSYTKGQMVLYNGIFYVFSQDHPAGAWNENHVVSSDLVTQIELLPDMIIQYVGQKGYGKTYQQPTDPSLDPDKNVAPGDYWIKTAINKMTWQDVKADNSTWNKYKTMDWSDLYIGAMEIYCRSNAGEWIQVYNTDVVSEAYTQITQTQFQITQEAYRANAAEGELRSSITQTADRITQEVSRATTAESKLIAKTTQYQTADAIYQDAVRYSDNNKIAKTSVLQTADAIVTEAVSQAATSASNNYIAKTSTYQTANSIVTEAVRQAASDASNSYIAKTSTYQTADSIVTVAERQAATNIAPAFSTSTTYAVGNIVSYQGQVYVFTSAHPAGAWNANHVSATNMSAQANNMYIAKTTSYQTADAIVTEAVSQAATSASNNYIAKTSTYQTADSIVTTAERQAATNVAPAFSTSTAYAVGDLVSYQGTVYRFKTAHSAGAWNSSHVTATNLATQSNNNYIAKTSTYQTADSIVTEAVSQAATSASSNYIAKTSTYQTASSIVSAAKTYTDNTLTDYSTTTQTSTMISSYVTNNAYGKVSGITITANGVDISGSQYVNISSGGTFKVKTGNFTIDTSVGNSEYVMYSGATTDSSSAFRLKKNGELTITKLKALDSEGTESDVNLRTAGLWKLSYHTVKAYTGNSLTLSNGAVINFNSASSLSIAVNGAKNVGIYSGVSQSFLANTTRAIGVEITSDAKEYSNGYTKFKERVVFTATGGGTEIGVYDRSVPDGRGDGLAYDAGYSSVRLSESWTGGQCIITKSTTGSTSITHTTSAAITYDSSTHKYTAKAYVNNDEKDRKVSDLSAFNDGVTAGEGHFTLATVTLQGEAKSVFVELVGGTSYYKKAANQVRQVGTKLSPTVTGELFYASGRSAGSGAWYLNSNDLYRAGTYVDVIDSSTEKVLVETTRYAAGTTYSSTYYTKTT